jgi:hypothetical protein
MHCLATMCQALCEGLGFRNFLRHRFTHGLMKLTAYCDKEALRELRGANSGVKHLSSKSETLDSILNTTKTKVKLFL